MTLFNVYQRWADRLNETAEYLDGPVRKAIARKDVAFNILRWAENAKPRPELTCGTAACVGGFATNIFTKSGLILKEDDGGFQLYDKNYKTESMDACRTFFGVSEPFDPSHYEHEYELAGSYVTLDVAIDELKRYANKMTSQARLFRG